jgi:hypothetical protein
MKTAKVVLILLLCSILFVRTVSSQTATEIPKKTGPVAFYTFDGRSTEIGSENINNMPPERGVFVKGVEVFHGHRKVYCLHVIDITQKAP